MSSSKMYIVNLISVIFLCLILNNADAAKPRQRHLPEYFQECRPRTKEFDNCMKNALNSVKPLFPIGDKEYGIGRLDPIFVKESNATRGNKNINIKFTLMNVVEQNWSKAKVINFQSDLDNYAIRFQEHWPNKTAQGDYEVLINVYGTPLKRSGKFLYKYQDFVMTSTVRAPPMMKDGKRTGKYGPIVVTTHTDSTRELSLEYTGLGGDPARDPVVNEIIHVLRREIWNGLQSEFNEIISKGFTQIFNANFLNIPIDSFFTRA